jgi:prophage tail gpP-like protein
MAPISVGSNRMRMRQVDPNAVSQEVATLEVGGKIFQDWETVWAQKSLDDPAPQFRFTLAEEDMWISPDRKFANSAIGRQNLDNVIAAARDLYRPDARTMGKINLNAPSYLSDDERRLLAQFTKFSVGLDFKLYLGTRPYYQIMAGKILVRQVAYDSNSHGVTLQGLGRQWFAARASIIHQKSEFEGSFEEIADKVLAPTCSKGYPFPGSVIDKTPFKPAVRSGDGETIYNFLERIGRDRKVLITGDAFGDFQWIGDHQAPVVGDLVEGQNILKMQCVIKDTTPHSLYPVQSPHSGSDESYMGDAQNNEVSIPGSAKCYSPLLTIAEHPTWTKQELMLRAQYEFNVAEGRRLEATITVQGWFHPKTGVLWNVGDNVHVRSPMCLLDDILKIKTVTFEQNQGGSTTTLVCVPPFMFNDRSWYWPGQSDRSPQPVINDKPPETPPDRRPDSEEGLLTEDEQL